MNSFFKAALFPAVICVFCLTGCATLPSKALYTESTVTGVTVNTTNSQFDVVYAIDCCIMPKAKDDFISFKVDTMLYTYRFDFSVSNGMIANHVRFSFLLKDGKKYLVLEGFQVETLDGKLVIDDYIDSIPFHYDDIKKAYNFFNDTDKLEENRQKQLHIALAAKQAEKDRQATSTTTESTDTVENSEKSSPKGQ